MNLVETTQDVSVYSDWYNFPTWSIEEGSNYQNDWTEHIETYKVSGAVGTWELTNFPRNTDS
jgi:hypothetical protein